MHSCYITLYCTLLETDNNHMLIHHSVCVNALILLTIWELT